MSNEQEAPNYCEDWKRKKEFFIPCMIDETGCACYRHLQSLTPASVEQPKQNTKCDMCNGTGKYEIRYNNIIECKYCRGTGKRFVELKEPEQPSEGPPSGYLKLDKLTSEETATFLKLWDKVEEIKFQPVGKGSGPGVDGELLEALKRLNKYANSANELYSGSPMDEEMERLIARAEGREGSAPQEPTDKELAKMAFNMTAKTLNAGDGSNGADKGK